MEREVLKRDESPLRDGIPESHLRSDPAVEELRNAQSVCPFWSGRHAEEFPGLNQAKQALI